MKVLMVGPGQRHNIKPFLDYFQANSQRTELTFLSTGRFHFDKEQLDRIKVYEFLIRPIPLIRTILLLQTKFELIWYHGAYHWPLALLIFVFKRSYTKVNLNVWNEKIPRYMESSNRLRRSLYSWYFAKSDFIQCNWYATEELVRRLSSNSNVNVLPWGLEASFMKDADDQELRSETKSFISNLPEDKKKFFFPKAISNASRHDLIVEAVAGLVRRGIDGFVVYFWLGRVDRGVLDKLEERIHKCDIDNYIRIVKMPFLPFLDMKAIWEAMDCGMQIVEQDQFSSTVTEPLYLKKELIISRIRPYEILVERFGLVIDPIENDSQSLQARMKSVISGDYKTADSELAKRSEFVIANLDFAKNLKRMEDFYIKRIFAEPG